MKFNKLYILAAAAAFSLTACDLNQLPGGSTITEDQFNELEDATAAAVRGNYAKLYAFGGDHDMFAQRSLDMYGDLLCGDMAMNSQNYGWFSTDEMMRTSTRAGYFWVYYYDFIRACNKGINAITKQGIPALDADQSQLTDAELESGYFYASLLTLRGWAYAGLMRYFSNIPNECQPTDLAVPIYTEQETEQDTILGMPRASVADVYARAEDDLLTAIDYYDAFNTVTRSSKLEVNREVALMTLAYMYLNRSFDGDYPKALSKAEELINSTVANLLPNEQVLTTGFNNVENNNWIWGQDVTVENYTALASFFGQCDIYSYSYASAGDVKGIDENLYKNITDNHPWDIRAFWWNNYFREKGKFKWAPDGKFYSAVSKKIQGDRAWLSDNIFMRLEQAYLIAAEAAWRSGDLTKAVQYLTAITDERVIEGKEAEYAAWKASLTTDAAVKEAIRYNWRVEMWGEGFGLQTFRRFGEAVTLGDNHLRSEKTISPNTPLRFTFDIPSSEYTYNPFIRDAEVEEVSVMKKQ